jgi:hypothetical protein
MYAIVLTRDEAKISIREQREPGEIHSRMNQVYSGGITGLAPVPQLRVTVAFQTRTPLVLTSGYWPRPFY